MHNHQFVCMEFHISRQVRERYQFDETLFTTRGNAIFANFQAVRTFAQKMNARRDLVNHPEQAVRAGQLNAMGLIDEILHQMVAQYRLQRNPQVMEQAIAWLEAEIGRPALDVALRQFAQEFPPMPVYRGEVDLDEYLAGQAEYEDGSLASNRQILLEEMLMLWLANANPAFMPFQELFNDLNLAKTTIYPQIIPSLRGFFATQPDFGPEGQNLIDVLRAPALTHPDSLTAQLEFIQNRWGTIVGGLLARMLLSLDLVKEEEKPVFGVGGPGPALVYEFKGEEYTYEPERFSPDLDWMPNLVLIAKNSYVWLEQLSRQYGRSITRLDQIPDEEMDRLARSGITGLWLIGLWERSPASQRIKQMRGNPDAVASAYSLFSYDIAADLGGEEAYRVLRDQVWRRGIRLASDMVPNHMGIDSRWVIEHPDWFISLNYSPFPTYTFNGQNLSWNDRVGIYLEDHYYNNSDAAVVFKRVDFWTGDEKYIYHGNDGTSMPWNDTAQLNYLIPEVREAVIQTILNVARKFPVIRFDAAMTLAKRHFHRLWFPEPGSGGDIPSRAEFGLTKARFDEVFPDEFWRDVVDRVAQEVPDTLLLAEAFWMMEGYFVRTLGMHRVYNSAFMNMLRDEKNAEYRLVVKNTIEFDPEILKRYVNFMNNPDERTAVDQFGKGDKYFGVCTLAATMPGLPMIGHGQIEGFTEKYGMEYKRAYWSETSDASLVERHQREIFPLLRRRWLFAEVSNFLLYDFYTPEGSVNEDVFAYSNRAGDHSSLVLYHNRYAETHGWVYRSAAFAVKTGPEDKILVQKTLGEGLGLHDEPGYYTIFRDHVTGLEYIRNSQELCQKGLYVELAAYKCKVLLDFREVLDDEQHPYANLAVYLSGGGAPSIADALVEMDLQPVLLPYRELVNPGMLNWLIQNRLDAETFNPMNFEMALEETQRKAQALLEAIREMEGGEVDPESLAVQMRRELKALLSVSMLGKEVKKPAAKQMGMFQYLHSGPGGSAPLAEGRAGDWGAFLACLITYRVGEIVSETDAVERTSAWMDEWLLGKIIAGALGELELSEGAARRQADLVAVLTANQEWFDPKSTPEILAANLLDAWVKNKQAQRYLAVHPHNGILWFNKEAFEELTWWIFALQVIRLSAIVEPGQAVPEKTLLACYAVVKALLATEEQSGYQLENLI
jgi:glycosidase